MRKLLLSITLLFITITSMAQIGFGYRFGIGNYKMSEMSSFLNVIQSGIKLDYPVPISVTDNFPNHYTNYGEITYSIKKNDYGVNFTYLSTGGRLAYSDYSGAIAYNLNANAYRIGAVYRNFFFQTNERQDKNLSLFAEISPAITINNITSDGYYQTPSGHNEIDKKHLVESKSTGFSVTPYMGIQWNIVKALGVNLGLGYNAEISGKSSEMRDAKTDWSGLRVGLGLNYKLTP
ncbi:hypothetical protein D3C87_140780 [compost metagenome]